jgi:hypothetical protein
MNSVLQRDEPGLTQLLIAWRGGNREAFERLLERAYGDLKRIAVQRLQRSAGR